MPKQNSATAPRVFDSGGSERTTKVARELLRIFFSNIKIGLVANVALALLLVVGLYPYLSHTELLVWFFIQSAINVARYLLCWWFARKELHYCVAYWRRLILVGVVLTAFVWAYAAIFFLAPPEQLPRSLVLMILAGVTAGSIRLLMTYPLASICYLALILIPLQLTMLYLPEVGSWTLAMATAAYLAFLVISSLALHTDMVQVIEKSISNDALVEELHKAKREAEAANGIATTLMAAASRELHESLQQLRSLTGLFGESVDPALSQEITEMAQVMALLTQLQSRTLVVQSHPLLLRALISESWGALAATAEDKEVRLRVLVNDALPTTIVGDFILLWRVLSELLRQALQRAKAGELLLQVGPVCNQKKEIIGLQFCVQTSGVASNELLSPLLQRYYLAGEEGIKASSRLDLSLVAVAELLRYLGSELCGELTRTACIFCFSQPLLSGEASLPSYAEDLAVLPSLNVASPAKKLKVLVRVDDVSSRLILEYLLRLAGHEPVVQTEDALVLNLLSEHRWDLIFIDQISPSAAGLDLLTVLAANPRYHNVPIVRLCEQQSTFELWPAGIVGVIGKPPRKLEVEECLKKWASS